VASTLGARPHQQREGRREDDAQKVGVDAGRGPRLLVTVAQ
jgi:hypothetical protein